MARMVVVQIGIAPKLEFFGCGRVGIPHLSLATNWDGIMRRSDESCHLAQTTRGAGEVLRLTPDE